MLHTPMHSSATPSPDALIRVGCCRGASFGRALWLCAQAWKALEALPRAAATEALQARDQYTWSDNGCIPRVSRIEMSISKQSETLQ